MARPTSFKSSDIIKAANELNKLSKNINGTSLRKLLGAGRPDALMKQYNELLVEGKITTVEETTEVAEVVEVRELPIEVQQSLDDAVTSLKNVVMHCNDIAHNTVESRLSAAIEKAKDTEINAAEEVEKAQQDLGNAYDEIEQLKDEYQTEIDLLNDKLSQSIQVNSDLRVDLTNTKKDFGTAQKSNIDLTAKLETKTSECHVAEQDSLVQKTRAEEVAKQLVLAQETSAELDIKLNDANSLNTKNLAEIATLTANLSNALEAKDEAKIEAMSQTEIANKALSEATTASAEVASTTKQIVTSEEREALLHKQLEVQAAEIAGYKIQIESKNKMIP
nr:hypothetical protein [Moritella viscosa]SHO17377.1 Putative uncharacterized protein [Moritella viscosa]